MSQSKYIRCEPNKRGENELQKKISSAGHQKNEDKLQLLASGKYERLSYEMKYPNCKANIKKQVWPPAICRELLAH